MQTPAHRQIALHEFESLKQHGALLLVGCTERGGGVSRPPYDAFNLSLHVGDDPDAVLENRRRLARALGVDLSCFVIPQQIHGGAVHTVGAAERGLGALSAADAPPASDALITRERGIVLAVTVADCVPLILFDPVTPAIGVVHAGWGGTLRHHIARNAVAAMHSELGSDPSTLLAGVGPAIGPSSYEVGADLAELARAEFPEVEIVRPHEAGMPPREGGMRWHKAGMPRHEAGMRPHEAGMRPHKEERFLLDLWSANVVDLVNAGISREHIELAGLDTFALPQRFFSHRRAQPTGRFLAFAMLRNPSGIVSGSG